MNVPRLLRHPALLVCVLSAATARGQTLPATPPSVDPSFWGHPYKPYVLKLVITSTNGTNPPKTRTSAENISRDWTGRVRIEDFYDGGQPRSIAIQDPKKKTFTLLQIVTKKAFVMPVFEPTTPLPGRGWIVESLPSRVLAGFPAEGLRFTRTIPASADGKRAEDRVVEEDWISKELCLVLEQRIESQRTGISIRTVASFKQVEPDSKLFATPGDYTLQQTPSSVTP